MCKAVLSDASKITRSKPITNDYKRLQPNVNESNHFPTECSTRRAVGLSRRKIGTHLPTGRFR